MKNKVCEKYQFDFPILFHSSGKNICRYYLSIPIIFPLFSVDKFPMANRKIDRAKGSFHFRDRILRSVIFNPETRNSLLTRIRRRGIGDGIVTVAFDKGACWDGGRDESRFNG